MAISNKGSLSKMFNVLSSEARLKALELFSERRNLMEIAEFIGMSRSGFQKVVEAFRELGLIEHTGHRSYYKLSRKGEKISRLVKQFGDELEPIEKKIAGEKIKVIAYRSGLTKEDIIKILEESENDTNE